MILERERYLIKTVTNGLILNSCAFFEQKRSGILIGTIEAAFHWHVVASYLQEVISILYQLLLTEVKRVQPDYSGNAPSRMEILVVVPSI